MRDQIYRQHEDDGKVRNLLEQGDMGYKPGGKFPYVDCSTERGQILAAVIGRNREEHEQMMAYSARLAEDAQPHIFVTKEMSPMKRKLLAKIEQRREGITDTTMDDPLIAPRDMKEEECIGLYGAISFANRHGVIMDVRVDFTWSQMGFVEHAEVAKALGRFLRNFNEWCFYRDFYCVWGYANEVGDKVGLHTHLMAAVPNEHRKAFRKWVRDFLGKQSRINPMPKTAVHFDTRPSKPMERQWRSFQYLSKGVSPYATVKSSLGGGETVFLSDLIGRGYECPGQMNCKRVGVSTHIGQTVRKNAGFKSLLDQGIADKRRLYHYEEYSKWLKDEWDKVSVWDHLSAIGL